MNASPSLDFDAMRATDLFGTRLTPPGFYYKTFIRPRRLWPLYEKVLRHAAGLGRLRRRQAEREWRTEYRRRHADVLVIGGGVAGMAAALQRGRAGRRRRPGRRRARARRQRPRPPGDDAGAARALRERLAETGVEVLAPAAALGFFDGIVPVWCGSTLHQVRAERHVAATGSIEQPLMFEGNDLPGVMLCSGAERLASLYGVRPGQQRGDRHHRRPRASAALALRAAGVEIAAVADARQGGADGTLLAALRRGGDPAPAGAHRRPRARTAPGQGGRARRPRRRGPDRPRQRAGGQLRPDRGLRRHRPGHLAAAPGRGEGALGRAERVLPPAGRRRRGSAPPARSPGMPRPSGRRPRGRSPEPKRRWSWGSATRRPAGGWRGSGRRWRRSRPGTAAPRPGRGPRPGRAAAARSASPASART